MRSQFLVCYIITLTPANNKQVSGNVDVNSLKNSVFFIVTVLMSLLKPSVNPDSD